MKVIDYLRYLRETKQLNLIISLANTQNSLLSIPPDILQKMEWYDYYEDEHQNGNWKAWSATIKRFAHCERNDLSRAKLFFEQDIAEIDWISTTHAKFN